MPRPDLPLWPGMSLFENARNQTPGFSIQRKPLVPPHQGQESEKSLREHPWGILLASSVFPAADVFSLFLRRPPALSRPFRHGAPGERAKRVSGLQHLRPPHPLGFL